MAIQSSINSLLSQAQSLAAFYKGFEKAGDLIKGQESQTEATKNLQKTFEERFRKEFNIDSKTPLTKEQKRAVEWGRIQEKRTGDIVEPSRALKAGKVFTSLDERRRLILEKNMEVKNEIASDLARASVEARTASINQSKSDFNAHTASLIKEYAKGSGNP